MKRSSSLRLTLWPMPSISVTSVPIVRPLSSPRKPSAYGGSLREPGGAHRCAPLRDCYPPGPLSSPRKPSAYGGSLREPGGAHRCAPLRDCYPPGPLSSRRGRGSLLGGHRLSRGLDRLHDVHVAGTPADVAGDGPTNLLLGGLRISTEQRGAGQHHGWRAEPTLETVFLLERALDRMELAILRQPFHGGDRAAVGLDPEHRAGLDRNAVHKHRAGAAVRSVAADMRAGEPEHAADEMHQEQARLDVGRSLRSIYGHGDLHDAPYRSRASSRAPARPRRTNTSTTCRL